MNVLIYFNFIFLFINTTSEINNEIFTLEKDIQYKKKRLKIKKKNQLTFYRRCKKSITKIVQFRKKYFIFLIIIMLLIVLTKYILYKKNLLSPEQIECNRTNKKTILTKLCIKEIFLKELKNKSQPEDFVFFYNYFHIEQDEKTKTFNGYFLPEQYSPNEFYLLTSNNEQKEEWLNNNNKQISRILDILKNNKECTLQIDKNKYLINFQENIASKYKLYFFPMYNWGTKNNCLICSYVNVLIENFIQLQVLSDNNNLIIRTYCKNILHFEKWLTIIVKGLQENPILYREIITELYDNIDYTKLSEHFERNTLSTILPNTAIEVDDEINENIPNYFNNILNICEQLISLLRIDETVLIDNKFLQENKNDDLENIKLFFWLQIYHKLFPAYPLPLFSSISSLQANQRIINANFSSFIIHRNILRIGHFWTGSYFIDTKEKDKIKKLKILSKWWSKKFKDSDKDQSWYKLYIPKYFRRVFFLCKITEIKEKTYNAYQYIKDTSSKKFTEEENDILKKYGYIVGEE